MDDIRSYKSLISAIVLRALYDAVSPPVQKGKTLSPLARDGIEFLFGDNIYFYLEFLNIDGKYFQNQLLKSMYRDDSTKIMESEFSPSRKRIFRINYQLWEKEKAELLLKIREANI